MCGSREWNSTSCGAGIAYRAVTAASMPSAVKCWGVLAASSGWHSPVTAESVS